MSTNHMQQVNVSGKGPHGKAAQVNGGSSAGSTPPGQPAAAPATMAPQQPPPSQSTSPPVNNAPKYGTLVPNRVFVGGISANTTEVELAQLFSAYGTVKATKIISDRAGVSKGYGFVTFESEEEAKRLQRESDNIMLRERRLNIAPAIKKQPFNRGLEVSSPPPGGQAQFYYAAGTVPYGYQNSMAYYTPAPPPPPPQTTGANGDLSAAQPLYQAPPVYATPTAAPPAAPYPMPMYPPQPLFVQHQYPYQPIPYDPQQYYGGGGGGGGQYGVYGGGGGGQSGGSPTRASYHAHGGGAGGGGGGQCVAHYGGDVGPGAGAGLYYNVPLYNVALEPAGGCSGGALYGGPEGLDPGQAAASQPPQQQQHHHQQQQEVIHIPSCDQSTAPVTPHYTPQQHTPVTTQQAVNGNHGNGNQQRTGYVQHQYVQYRQQAYQPAGQQRQPVNHRSGSLPSPAYVIGAPAQFRVPQSTYIYSNTSRTRQSTNQSRCDSNYCRSWSKKQRRVGQGDSCSVSSARTDSNSSASAVDENLNERKGTSNSSPPPTPYSPMARLETSAVGSTGIEVQQNHHGSQQSGYYQSSGRRNRRNNPRRNSQQAQHGAAPELGAGDAPLPSEHVTDMCAKIDSLKL